MDDSRVAELVALLVVVKVAWMDDWWVVEKVAS